MILAKRTDPEKVRRAAAHADRSGEACKAVPKRWAPHVDFCRCEGKGDCEQVCPYDVFEIRPIANTDYRALSWINKAKVAFHGGQVAYTPNADSCMACGLCAIGCPESAITLVRRADDREGFSAESQ